MIRLIEGIQHEPVGMIANNNTRLTVQYTPFVRRLSGKSRPKMIALVMVSQRQMDGRDLAQGLHQGGKTGIIPGFSAEVREVSIHKYCGRANGPVPQATGAGG